MLIIINAWVLAALTGIIGFLAGVVYCQLFRKD